MGERGEHTSGPWVIKELMGRSTVQARHPCTAGLPHATGFVVIATPAPYGVEHHAEREATVALIAAAPELLKACIAFADRFHGGSRADTDYVAGLIDAAIAKARGNDGGSNG